MDKLVNPLKPDDLQRALFEDRFPVTYHDCVQVSTIIDEALERKGFYTLQPMVNGMGHILTAYNSDEEVFAHFVINRPVEAENRRIPTLPWLRYKFKHIGYDFKDKAIRTTLQIIERHIGDGGTWEYLESAEGIHFELSLRGKLKTKLSYYKEDLFVG